MRRCPACQADAPDEAEVCPVDGTALPPPDPLVGRTIRGRYQVVRKLGEGGVGAVYLAEQVKIKRTVALKVLHEETAQDEALIERFRREARAMARLDPRHATLVHDLDQTESGRLFIVMEYLEGRTLRQVLDQEGPLPVARALALAMQMAEGLAIAHSAGVLHRDVKPHTIMVLPDDTVKVMDFGLTRLGSRAGEGPSRRGAASEEAVAGIAYAAPERPGTSTATARSDLYSLGAVLHEMLSGDLPLAAGRSRLGEKRPGLPRSLEALVAQLLETDPGQRPGDAREVLERLRAAVAEVDAGRSLAPDDETVGLPLPGQEAVEASAATGGAAVASPAPPGETIAALARGDLPGEARRARRLLAWPRFRVAAAVAAAVVVIAGGVALVGPREGPGLPGPGIQASAVDPDQRPPDTQPAPDPVVVVASVVDPPAEPAPATVTEPPAPERATDGSPAAADDPALAGQGPIPSGDPPPVEPGTPAGQAEQVATPVAARSPESALQSALPPGPPAVPLQARRPPEVASAPPPSARLRVPDPGQIRAAVQERLRGRGLLRDGTGTPTGLGVEVGADGAVTLTGILNTREERDRAIGLARSVPGVTEVRTRINVRESWQGGS